MRQFTGYCRMSPHTLGTVVSFQCSEVNTVVLNHSIYAHCMSNRRDIHRAAKILCGDLVQRFQSIPKDCIFSYMCVFTYMLCLPTPGIMEQGAGVLLWALLNVHVSSSLTIVAAVFSISAHAWRCVCMCGGGWVQFQACTYVQCTSLWH